MNRLLITSPIKYLYSTLVYKNKTDVLCSLQKFLPTALVRYKAPNPLLSHSWDFFCVVDMTNPVKPGDLKLPKDIELQVVLPVDRGKFQVFFRWTELCATAFILVLI